MTYVRFNRRTNLVVVLNIDAIWIIVLLHRRWNLLLTSTALLWLIWRWLMILIFLITLCRLNCKVYHLLVHQWIENEGSSNEQSEVIRVRLEWCKRPYWHKKRIILNTNGTKCSLLSQPISLKSGFWSKTKVYKVV